MTPLETPGARSSALTAGAPHSAPFWSQPISDLLARLGTSGAGLGTAAAAAARAVHGPNVLSTAKPKRLLFEFLARFKNPLVIVLLAASGLSAVLGEVRSFAIIFAIVLFSIILDFVQERRAGQAAERLRDTVMVRASVLRDGAQVELPIAELVPGDIVLLAAGDLVPADARLIEARDLFVNEALLTGESFPVEKHAADADPATEVTGATNVLLMGTSVLSGSARAVLAATGRRTAIAQIADSLGKEAPPTAFQKGTQAFGVLIMRLTVLLVLFVLLANAAFHRPLLESFLFAVALAVGLTPELLPMVVSVTLARGALRLTKHRVIVKRLSAVQDLGAMDVLCTDKTGTLTEGKIKLERHVDAWGNPNERVLELAWLNSHFESGIRSPLDEAILAHKTFDASNATKIDEVPFDFERRRVSVLIARDGDRLLLVKGSPEDVLALCSRCDDASGGDAELDAAGRERITGIYDALSRDGFRALGVAWRRVAPDHTHAVLSDEVALTFAGFAAFLDPPKESAREALAALAASGIAVKVVSGDNELVARHVCEAIGLPVGVSITGPEIAAMSDDALRVQAERATLFTRVTPAQKTRILGALRARGHVVGFLGDGVNDAPSLHMADVGISVDTAVDVAKAAADLILLDQDLRVLHEGVREGRRTFGNVMKYIMMGTSSNFGNMFSMAGATLVLPFLPMLPMQVLLNNFLYDFSEIAIPLDHVEEATLASPRAWDIAFVRRFMIVFGLVSSLFDFLTFWMLRFVFRADASLFHTGWFVESIATQVLVIFIIRTRGSPWASRPHPWLVALALAVVAVAALLPLSPLAAFLGFVAPPPAFYAALAGIVAAYLVVVQGAKQLFYRAESRRERRAVMA